MLWLCILCLESIVGKVEVLGNNNFVFYTDLLNSESWLENVSMQNQPKFNLSQVKKKILEFKNELDLKFDIKNNKNEFASHFISWLNKQKNEKKNLKVQHNE